MGHPIHQLGGKLPNPMTRNPCKGSEKDCLDFHGETTVRRWERAWQSENGTDLVCVWCQQLSYIFKNAWCHVLSTLPFIIILLLQARRNRTWIMVCLATFNSSTIKYEILAWLQGRWGFCAASMVSFQATATHISSTSRRHHIPKLTTFWACHPIHQADPP